MVDLIINGEDAWSVWGVRMGNGYLDTLGASAALKDSVMNKSRLEHGARYDDNNPKFDERDLTLVFTLTGKDRKDFLVKRKAFLDELYKINVTIAVPQNSDDIYHLRYTGKSVTYSQNISRTFAKIAVKFNEPNPFRRGEE